MIFFESWITLHKRNSSQPNDQESQQQNQYLEVHLRQFRLKQDSKELSPRPLENAPKTFNSKKNSLF